MTTWIGIKNRTVYRSKISSKTTKQYFNISTSAISIRTILKTSQNMQTPPSNKSGILIKKKDNWKCHTILQRPFKRPVALTQIQKVLVWLVQCRQTKSLILWAHFGSLMAETKPQRAKMVVQRDMFWIILHINKPSQFMGNCHHLILSPVPNLLKDGLSFRVKVKLCKLIARRAMRRTTRSRRTRRNAWKITRGAKIVATWHHKSHCHSKVNLPQLKNSARGELKQFKNKCLYQV